LLLSPSIWRTILASPAETNGEVEVGTRYAHREVVEEEDATRRRRCSTAAALRFRTSSKAHHAIKIQPARPTFESPEWCPDLPHLTEMNGEETSMQIIQSRRRFLAGVSLAGAAGLVGAPRSLHAEPPPETTTVRLAKIPSICTAPQYVAEELLRAEGFTDVRYVVMPSAIQHWGIARGEVDFSLHFAAPLVIPIDAGEPITVLAGVHPGCFELIANERIHSITDLKGKSVGVQGLGSSPHVFVSAMATYVGLDPVKDIDWVVVPSPSVKPMQLFAEGKIDAFLGTPPDPQELRARHIGHVVVNSSVDHPWSQYFCCMLAGNADFVQRYPFATKRVLRAILKATDLCAAEPKRVAQRLVDGGFTARYDFALETLNEVPYDKWRQYDPEDTIRFYALLLRDVGMIKSSPQKIIADGTDWRFLDELKRELKT
jgi:NitT/TauT family transport system substrate-binding protein